MNPRIVLAANTTWYLFNFRSALARALLKRGYGVTTLSPRDTYAERLVSLGCDAVHIGMDNKGVSPVKDLATLRGFRRAYREISPAVVVHFTVKPVIYGTLAARSLAIPVVNTITGLGTAFVSGGPIRTVVETLYRISQGWPTRVFFQNPDDMALFLRRGLVPRRHVSRLPGSGVDLERFSLEPLPDGPRFTFLLVGRLIRDKGIGEFIDAARILRACGSEARFQLLGPSGVANRTAVQPAEITTWEGEGLVEYLGATDDVRPMLKQADCIVLPSYREGTPRTLLEGAAMGRPIIASDVPGCRETVDEGVTGFLCQARSAEDLADKMLVLMRLSPGERARMGREGRRKMERSFDERSVVNCYLGAIDEALSGCVGAH